MNEQPSPERAVRLLRAKAAELENQAKWALDDPESSLERDFGNLTADIALVATLLADHIERTDG